MMKLADYLFRITGSSEFGDYWEDNLINGILAQGYVKHEGIYQNLDDIHAKYKIVTYYLPMKAGSKKKWGSENDHFWCCHCTLLNAHSFHNNSVYYHNKDVVYINQFINSKLELEIEGRKIFIQQDDYNLYGDTIRILPEAYETEEKPDHIRRHIKIENNESISFILKIRHPKWCSRIASCKINGTKEKLEIDEQGFLNAKIDGSCDLVVDFPKKIRTIKLPGSDSMFAFKDGPTTLVGLVDKEVKLKGNYTKPEEIITVEGVRSWNNWTSMYKTINQNIGFSLIPIKDVVDQEYTMYFPIENK